MLTEGFKFCLITTYIGGGFLGKFKKNWGLGKEYGALRYEDYRHGRPNG